MPRHHICIGPVDISLVIVARDDVLIPMSIMLLNFSDTDLPDSQNSQYATDYYDRNGNRHILLCSLLQRLAAIKATPSPIRRRGSMLGVCVCLSAAPASRSTIPITGDQSHIEIPTQQFSTGVSFFHARMHDSVITINQE